MTIQSMTGFARAQGQNADYSWTWEIRSLNGKGLDVRLRLPPSFEELDTQVRKAISDSLVRGNIQINLQFASHSSRLHPKLDEKLALELLEAAKSLQEKIGGDLPNLSQIMTMRGVIEYEEMDVHDAEKAERNQVLMADFDTAVATLVKARTQEGAAIKNVLSGQLARLGELSGLIKNNDARHPEAIKKQLSNQLARLFEVEERLDPQRLHQEAVIIAAKADIQEELDRLDVHLKSGNELLSGAGPVGRKLDFLAQEFNRECNTICSKSNSAEVTALGLDMKLVIDQFREQVQNME